MSPVTCGASHYWLLPAFGPAGSDYTPIARPAKSRQQARLPAPQTSTGGNRVRSLSEKTGQSRLESGPQVTNLPHKARSLSRPEGRQQPIMAGPTDLCRLNE